MAAHKTATMKLVCVSCDCADDLSVVVVVLVVVVVDEDRVVEEVVLEESSSCELGSVWRLGVVVVPSVVAVVGLVVAPSARTDDDRTVGRSKGEDLIGETVVDGGNPVPAVPPKVISPELQSSVTHGQTVALIFIVMRMG